MVVDNLDVIRMSFRPAEADPPLVVDADAVLALEECAHSMRAPEMRTASDQITVSAARVFANSPGVPQIASTPMPWSLPTKARSFAARHEARVSKAQEDQSKNGRRVLRRSKPGIGA